MTKSAALEALLHSGTKHPSDFSSHFWQRILSELNPVPGMAWERATLARRRHRASALPLAYPSVRRQREALWGISFTGSQTTDGKILLNPNGLSASSSFGNLKGSQTLNSKHVFCFKLFLGYSLLTTPQTTGKYPLS